MKDSICSVKEGEMDNSKDRETGKGCGDPDRKTGRFVVPGATVLYKERSFWRRKVTASEERSPVVNISRTGLAFLTDIPPKTNRVTLLLSYPEKEEPTSFEGRVIYSVPRASGLDYRYRVGVQFSPFSARRGHNSKVSLGVLDYLEKTHAAGSS
jgi:hypothetical protein